MKKVLFIAAVMAVFGCTKGNEQKAVEWPVEAICTMTVDYLGEPYVTEGVRIALDKAGEGRLNLKLYQVKFVPQMPVSLDITVPSIPYVTLDNVLTLSGNDIVPTMPAGGVDQPVERYKTSNIGGTYNPATGAVSVSLYFGIYKTVFVGAAK